MKVVIERQDGAFFCGIITRHDGNTLRWSAQMDANQPGRIFSISFYIGSCLPTPGGWVDRACDAISGAIAGRLQLLPTRQESH